MSRLVLLSGWGCDARIWEPLAAHWPSDLVVHAPDWPGYGAREALNEPGSLDALATAMADDLPDDAVWVGWSLGGLLAGALLDRLPTPRALVLLGMGERFCHPEGVDEAALTTFRNAFRHDPGATWAHFLRWQLRGEPAPRSAHRGLLELIGDEPPASPPTLAAGLSHLARLDNAARLGAPPCPLHRLAGEADPLLAPAVRQAADRWIPQAGHCPMLSQPARLAATLAAIAVEPSHRLSPEEASP